MKIGDLIINPYVQQYFKNKPNPMYKTMVMHIGAEYTRALRYDGKVTTWYTRDAKCWNVVGNVDIKQLILNGFCEVE